MNIFHKLSRHYRFGESVTIHLHVKEMRNRIFAQKESVYKNELLYHYLSIFLYELAGMTEHYRIDIKNAFIERLTTDQSLAYTILEKNLKFLTGIPYVYSNSDTLQKREFINLVFDNNLYYENSIYRTPAMLNIFSHNHLKMREKGYLIYKK